MDNSKLLKELPEIKQNEPLAKHTTIKIGGPAEFYYEAKKKEDFVKAIQLAHQNNITVTILGWGSNVLVSDKGIKGLVVVNKANNLIIFDEDEGKQPIEIIEKEEKSMARLDQIDKAKYGDFSRLDYDESNLPISKVYMDAGVSLQLAIFKTIEADLTGLQWFAGIPGTIGGAVYNNIHGGTHFISEVIENVEILDKKTLKKKILKKKDLETNYDYSTFQKTNDYILGVTFNLYHGDSERAMFVYKEWRRQKSLIQPSNSAGCIWKNLSEKEKRKLNLQTSSMGYVIEHILKLKGMKSGDARISDKHAAFIVNDGKARAVDVLALMKKIYYTTKQKLRIKPKPEIFLLGFDNDEIKEFLE